MEHWAQACVWPRRCSTQKSSAYLLVPTQNVRYDMVMREIQGAVEHHVLPHFGWQHGRLLLFLQQRRYGAFKQINQPPMRTWRCTGCRGI